MTAATGDCFEAAIWTAYQIPDDERDQWRVCHGWPTGQGPIEGVVHAHAWLERTDPVPEGLPEQFAANAAEFFTTVIDKSNGKDLEVSRTFYYSVGRIRPDQVHRYEIAQAFAYAVTEGHYGPWEPMPETALPAYFYD